MGELIRLLHSNNDESPSSVQTPTVQTVPKTDDNQCSCDEEIQMETEEAQGGEDPHSSPKTHESPSVMDLGDSFPCDDHFIESILHDLSV